jgi:HD-like signal output (HDOD) protein
MADGQIPFLVAEKEILGFAHPEIAYELCKTWKVPQSLGTAIRYHHSPANSQGNELAYIVHMADAVAMMSGMGAGVDGMLYEMDDGAMGFLGLQEEDISVIMVEMVESVGKIKTEMQAS